MLTREQNKFWIKLSLVILILYGFVLQAQNNCPNSNFSTGNFTNWEASWGPAVNGPINQTQNIGIGTEVNHTIITTSGIDPNTCGNLEMIPPGASYSCKLGNDDAGCGSETLSYSFIVDMSNRLFTYQYAVVLEDPGTSHSISEKPRFTVEVLDVNGNQIGSSGSCFYYDTYGGSPINSFAYCGVTTTYSNWKKVTIDLTSYISNPLTIRFTTKDCSQCGHFGYAYLTTKCAPFELNLQQNCNGSVTLNAPDGFTSYLWTPGGQNTQSISLNNLTTGNYTYGCNMSNTTEDGTICPAFIDTTFSFIQPVLITVNSPTICFGESVTLSAVSDGSAGLYFWSPGGETTQSIVVSPNTTSNYTVTYSNPNGCNYQSVSTVTVNPLPVFNVPDVSICADHFVTLTAIPSSYSYNWDHGISNNVPFIPPYTDTYYVIATDPSTGCVQDGNADVVVHPNPIANFTDICGSIPATLTNTSIGAVNYYWDMGDGSPILTTKDIRYSYTIMDSIFYNVTLIAETEFGCLDTVSRIFNTPLLFYVPNTFTPDGDEYNNTFIPVFSNKNKVESIHLLIYNRWGEIVFESENIDFGWDGTYKNRKAQDGTYTWELIFTDNSCIGKKEHLYGHVNLIR